MHHVASDRMHPIMCFMPVPLWSPHGSHYGDMGWMPFVQKIKYFSKLILG